MNYSNNLCKFLILATLLQGQATQSVEIKEKDYGNAIMKRNENEIHNRQTSKNVFTYIRTLVGQWTNNMFASSALGWKTIGSDLDGSPYYDNAGQAVAINGDGSRVVVGAPNSLNGNGDVKVYEWEDTTEDWVQLGISIVGSDGDFSGASLDMSSSGDKIIVGSPYHQNYYGTTRVYEWNDSINAWEQLGSDLDADERYDESGNAVSISGDGMRIAIGSPDGVTKTGFVKVYYFDAVNSNSWEQIGNTLYGAGYYSRKGNSVSLNYDGSRMVLGSHLFDFNATSFAGSVNVYEYHGTNETSQWIRMGSRILGDVTYYELYGHSVDINDAGDRIVIGAINGEEDSTTLDNGLVEVFEFNSNDWTQLGSAIYGAVSGDNLGETVSMNGAGDRIVAGASFADGDDDFGDHNVGQVQVFDYDTDTQEWVQVGDTILGECGFDQSGKSVAMSGDGSRLIVGAPFNDYYAGHARVYEGIPGFVDYNNDHCFTSPVPTPTPTTKVPTTVSPTPPTTSSPTVATEFPTSTPTQAPSTSHPTLAPTETCTSSPLEFALGGYELDCDWVASDPVTNCAYDSATATHCPQECGVCDTYRCEDSEALIIYKNSERRCSDLDGLSDEILATFCARYNDIMLTCRGTCNFCTL